jgi:2-keto-4-pentenoate hydratase/2-oxohepta-3-ene-1,7-dioic acid hydratase in catechol pathway
VSAVEPFTFSARRLVALGLTWRDHARETGEPIAPDGPARFTRDPASLAAPGRVVLPSRARIRRSLDALEPGLGDELARRHPDFPALLDHEIELGLVVLADGRTGWFLANDVTVRTVQILGEGSPRRMEFWSASKSFPGTLVVGPSLLRAEETPDVELVLRVRGEVRQRARSTEILYPAALLRQFAALEPGDAVLTGTPAGVAIAVPRWKRWVADTFLDRWRKLDAAIRGARRSRRFLEGGDVIDMEAGPLGRVSAVVEVEAE